jgi:transposase
MRKLYSVNFTDSDVERLKKLIRQKSTTETMVLIHIKLDMDENHVTKRITYNQCAEKRGVSYFTVARVVRVCATEGVDVALKYHRNENSGIAHRKMDGRMEATLIQIACSPVSEGHARWTISMLTGEMRIRFGENSIGRDTVWRTLKK